MLWELDIWHIDVCHVCHDECGVCGEDQLGHGVRRCPVEGEREQGGETTLIQYELNMQQLIARISKILHFSPYVQVRSNLSVTVEKY